MQRYVEDLISGPNTEIGPKDFFAMASNQVLSDHCDPTRFEQIMYRRLRHDESSLTVE
jgi:hypothetical protein